ncbi:Hpt domain-containing protein [Undibacterium sp. Ren11W]|uniref:response regulator n=1 Tax=Undibacterium sp. Ren11W TaxID=3413045 RepID=UPI003BF22CF6
MDQVKAMLNALRINYLTDFPTHIDELEQLLLELERHGYGLEICRDLYRRVHSLKGSGGTYGLHVLSDICHPFEDLLSHLLENNDLLKENFTEIALLYVDLLRQTHSVYTDGVEPGAEIHRALQGIRKRSTKSSHSALLVESSEVILGLLKDVLSSQGFRIEVVNDGYLALGRVLAEHFDLLITSLETKRLNGLALISAVQKSGARGHKTKTILLTTKQLNIVGEQPDFIIKKDAHLKDKFKEIVLENISS